jgi:hypothetical protein
MDRGQTYRRALSGTALALLLAAASDVSSLPIQEARWLAPGSRFTALIREPTECLILPADPAERRSIAIGRIAFRTPLLLGGQAARAGISCATCHRNGRGNPAFHFVGLSGAPGTADVTSSLMSSHRGDRVANPTPIPDLGGPRDMLKVPHSGLERFIRGLVVEEFDGAEPGSEILGGLVAYVRALGPEGCGRSDQPIRLAARLGEVDTAVRLARNSSGDTRRLLLGAARSSLGTIDERFRIPGLEAERALLAKADRQLHQLRSGGSDFENWNRSWAVIRRKLLLSEARSLFNPGRLRRALAAHANEAARNGSIPPPL